MSDPKERDLEEVERALSVLGGRHPDAVRAEREDAQAAERRRREHELVAAADRRRALRRRLVVAAALAVLGGAGFAAFRFRQKRAAIDAEMTPLVARFTSHGFDALPRGAFAAEDRVELTTIAGDCYAFVAARGAQLRIERPIGSAGAKGDAIVCTCASENVVVSAGGAAVRALHVSGNALGGSRGVPYRFADETPLPTVVAGDDACSDDELASFARDARYPKQGADGAFLAVHAALASSGFTTVASAPARLAFVFVPPARGAACFVAASESGELALWTLDGGVQKPVQHAKGAIAWCAAKPATFVVEGSAVTVLSAPSPRIGGLVGLRENLRRAKIEATTWIRDDDRGAIAADTLRASLVPDPVAIGAQTIVASATKDVRVLVFSSADKLTFASNEADFRCDPPLEAGDALCVQAHALTWHEPPPRTDGTTVACGAAYGPLPYWMSALADVRDARVVDAELDLVGFARRMAARGFVPGVIEGVTERKDSVEVLGRSGDDAIVAVGLWPAAPFIHPYGVAASERPREEEGEPWTLDGEPRVIPLTGGVHVTLKVPDGSAVPLEARRTVVFRHSTRE